MSIIQSMNPATGQNIATYTLLDQAETFEKVDRAGHLQKEWSKTSFQERSTLMKKVGELLLERKTDYAKLMTEEMGKPIKQAISEIEKCAWVCHYYAEHAAAFLEEEPISTDAQKSYIKYQPLGVVLAIMPWNFPFWQVFRFAAPALMAGNAGLLKHAENVPGCALAIEEIFEEAGFPKGLFPTLIIDKEMTAKVIEYPVVKAVTLTGSGRAGAIVASEAARHLKKSVLELGGSDPYIILEDANIEEAAKICAQSRLLNSGQSCIGAKRFIVVESVYDAFLEEFKIHLQAARVGDPTLENTTVGPIARFDLRENLHNQVQKSIEGGATCILGGTLPDGPGAFYPPTILTHVQPGTPAYEEELFGPVAAMFCVANEEAAIKLANDTNYGLGAAVFTGDIGRGERIAAEELEAGCCFVNGMVKSDPRLPFGGIKISGFGRELSHHGIKEFMNVKTVYIT